LISSHCTLACHAGIEELKVGDVLLCGCVLRSIDAVATGVAPRFGGYVETRRHILLLVAKATFKWPQRSRSDDNLRKSMSVQTHDKTRAPVLLCCDRSSGRIVHVHH
jgi:hypothetical protein